jgi:hypothetical protein
MPAFHSLIYHMYMNNDKFKNTNKDIKKHIGKIIQYLLNIIKLKKIQDKISEDEYNNCFLISGHAHLLRSNNTRIIIPDNIIIIFLEKSLRRREYLSLGHEIKNIKKNNYAQDILKNFSVYTAGMCCENYMIFFNGIITKNHTNKEYNFATGIYNIADFNNEQDKNIKNNKKYSYGNLKTVYKKSKEEYNITLKEIVEMYEKQQKKVYIFCSFCRITGNNNIINRERPNSMLNIP